MFSAGKGDEGCAWNLARHPAGAFHRQPIFSPVDHGGWNCDRGQNIAHVDVLIHLLDLAVGVRAAPRPHRSRGPLEARIPNHLAAILVQAQRCPILPLRAQAPAPTHRAHVPRGSREPGGSGATIHRSRAPLPGRGAKRRTAGSWSPSEAPITAARDEPTASITARTSSIRVSRSPTFAASEAPVPRLSKRMRRHLSASALK